MVWIVLILVALIACGAISWGMAGAATNLALAGGIAISQTTIALLVIALMVMSGLMAFVAFRAFRIGQESIEPARSRRLTQPLRLQPGKTRRSRARTAAVYVARGFFK